MSIKTLIFVPEEVMGRQSYVSAILALSLIANALCVPISILRIKRQSADSSASANVGSTTKADNDQSNVISSDDTSVDSFKDEDDDYEFPTYPADDSSGGGSNLFSLLNLVTGLASGSSGSGGALQKFFKSVIKTSKPMIIRRHSIKDNEIVIDHKDGIKPPLLLRQETENVEAKNSESESNQSDDNNSGKDNLENDEEKNKSDEDTLHDSFDDDDNYDEPPGGGDGEGGGFLGLLAGLSGGEDGQSDLGSLLATVSGIIANLSGDGIDLNALIASGIGLFVGLLSEGEQNPGEILASYLLTSLDTITGGGAQNNGAFFGKFLSKLVKGTSAGGDPDADSEDNGNNMETKDSAGFFASFLMGLLGDMSKTSSGSHPMRRSYFENKPSFLY